jgi:hypothetical protein
MANICINREAIIGPKEEVENLYEDIKEAYNISGEKYRPISVIRDFAGVSENCYFRGDLDEIYIDYDVKIPEIDNDYAVIFMSTETAWSPFPFVWEKILNALAPNSKYYFISEEPGCELFIRYDPYDILGEKDFYVDIDFTDCVTRKEAVEKGKPNEYFYDHPVCMAMSEYDFLEYFGNAFNKKFDNVLDAFTMIENFKDAIPDDVIMSIYNYEDYDPSEWIEPESLYLIKKDVIFDEK